MKKKDERVHAYHDRNFLDSREGRGLRILSEYLEPQARFQKHRIHDTIVFMGSARTPSREQAEAMQGEAEPEAAARALEMSAYYEAARELARRMTEWSKGLADPERRFVVCTGGGPGIMEAANRGAAEADGANVGLTISIPMEEFDNPYITQELHCYFHYFFMRKFWFTYLAKGVVLFPGGFGTLDELFEILTLVQTRKMTKKLPIVLFGTSFWNEVVNFDALVRYGTISPGDLALFHSTDSVDDAYDFLTRELVAHAMQRSGAVL
ncbi:TIGR00730 family Rossman fold protein [Marinibaculum pumilum]|uniref:Cytokinin riboside 5'-monophosphate phosphoribohydrolase n=1 Tax=Marinibaculum pumilum TaxID=1766165 RepID=A0ABV7L3N5_9PROT